MSTWKSMLIGGRDHAFRCVVAERSALAVIVASDWPCILAILLFVFERKKKINQRN
jgi:hypothetical protein